MSRFVFFLLPAAVLVAAAGASDAELPIAVERHAPADGHASLGPADAPDTLTLFLDYQCPVCRRAEREMERLVRDFDGALRVEIRHNPLAMHRSAFDAALAAKAAQRQGRFWEFHALALDARAHDRESLVRLAVRAGCDETAFRADLAVPALRSAVEADVAAAAAAGARATPGFVINGHVENGWASYEWIAGVVRKHLRGGASAAD